MLQPLMMLADTSLFPDKGLALAGIAIGVGLIVMGAARGIGHIAGNAMESIARQPEAGGPIGTNVLTNQRVRLINRAETRGMVYCQRPVGINLAWQDNCTEALGYRVLIDYLCSINPIC